MHPYRTHKCNDLNTSHAGEEVRLSGWVHRKRDHGNLLFIDVRDHYGITQCVMSKDNPYFQKAEEVRAESVVRITGRVVKRTPDTVNDKIATGEIEVKVEDFHVSSKTDELPLQVFGDAEFPEETRLTYRFLDLRREKLHQNIVLRSKVISALRTRMEKQGFGEYHTPILTASSPEGARDFLVPSRLHPGKFYALPQAPQMFKQLIMVAGFDRYFQIAPCFRDEDPRADRSPGEFYQLDFEMSFVTQDDVFAAIEPVVHGTFEEFSGDRDVTPLPFPRMKYDDVMLKYGCDKPDLRNPLTAADVTEIFDGGNFAIFAKAIKSGSVVRAVAVPGVADQPRSFFDKMNDWARGEGAPGLGYITFQGEAKGPIAKFLTGEQLHNLKEKTGATDGSAIFFMCDKQNLAEKLVAATIKKLGVDLDLVDKTKFALTWIVDYPMYEFDDKTQKIAFSHNPFSMPQGGMETLEKQDPLTIKAFQYDLVCNGYELGSGAIRNHLPEIMYKAFGIAGYAKEQVEKEFKGMLNAFKFGAPAHGGAAFGVERIVMLLADETTIREVVMFPMNQQALDLMMGAPSEVSDAQLREIHIKRSLPPTKKDDDKKKTA